MNLTKNHILILIFFSSLGALLMSAVLDLFWHFTPCTLCTYQRGVLLVSTLVTGVGAQMLRVSPRLVFGVLLILFTSNAALAGYQVALEYGWIEESIFCKPAADLLNARSLEELRHSLIAEGFKDCSKPKNLLFGLSLAFYNFCLSCTLSLLSLIGLRRRR